VRRLGTGDTVAHHTGRAVAAGVSKRWCRVVEALYPWVARACHQACLKVSTYLTVTSVAWRAVSTIEGAVNGLVAVNFASKIVIEARFEKAFSVVDTEPIVTVTDVRVVASTKKWSIAGHVVPLARCVFVAHVPPSLSTTQVERWQLVSGGSVQVQKRRVSAPSFSDPGIDVLSEDVV
jgi:hypothetical protein